MDNHELGTDPPQNLLRAYIDHYYVKYPKEYAILFFASALAIIVLIFVFMGKVPNLMLMSFGIFVVIGIIHGIFTLIYGKKRTR